MSACIVSLDMLAAAGVEAHGGVARPGHGALRSTDERPSLMYSLFNFRLLFPFPPWIQPQLVCCQISCHAREKSETTFNSSSWPHGSRLQ
ncbi:hypothetical protein BS78_09G007100 [Paspalum vaginatum]|uniref:Secreted protein n=1 Tax=Paspalum vaginatum TaxID=158149 RepID=A0A9W8CEV0_9POAL|nr:hypothetical protein BS78_K282900 [Paspalum vaginatum]KAJ1261164.1 hypothetical protein BS78_09G007100 [Paspalum vaginatum]